MKKIFISLMALAIFFSCREDIIVPDTPVVPDADAFEQVDFMAYTDHNDNPSTRVSFEHVVKEGKSGLAIKWLGDEELSVYIKHKEAEGYSYTFAGRIPSVGAVSADGYALQFAGPVAKRPDPEDTFVMVYDNSGKAYDWTKQSLNFTDQADGVDGLKAFHKYAPLIWDGNELPQNKSCIIKFTASNLGPGVKVKSLNIHSETAVFPKSFDLDKFTNKTENLSKTLSYAFENLVTDANGKMTVYLSAPLIPAGDKSYDIHVVVENSLGTISTLKARKGIDSRTALSESKQYKLSRGDDSNPFSGATNPAATVGISNGGQNGSSDVVVESIVGQWDKTGYLSNDIYGVLDMGKPEQLTVQHNTAINSLQKIYSAYFSGDTDTKIHKGAVAVAGKAGQSEKTGLNMAENGPQYVTSIDNTGTFNNIVLTKDTEVYMTFIDSKAWNTNTIGYYCYAPGDSTAAKEADGHKFAHDLIVFPSTSQSTVGEHLLHKFEPRTTAQLLYPQSEGTFARTFPAGTTIGIMERVNALESIADFALKPISENSPVHYTNIAWNKLNTFGFRDYWNQIAVLKFHMPGDKDADGNDSSFNRHGLIYAMKDAYYSHGYNNNSYNWTNPIILIYTSEPDAIDFRRSAAYWTHTVDISNDDATFNLSYNLESVTSDGHYSSVKLSDDKFENGVYSTTVRVANQEFGSFAKLMVTIAGVDVTSKVVKANDGYQAQIQIPKSEVCGDVVITALASRKVYVQSLTARDLMELARETPADGLPRFRLILHSSTNGLGNVAFGMSLGANSYCLNQADSPLYNANSQHVFANPTQVTVQDQYNNYEWSIEGVRDASDNFVGFKLKKVTKYTDTDVKTDGFISRGPNKTGNYPYVCLMAPDDNNKGTVLTAEQVGGTYEMRIKSADTSFQYMTCAIGQTLRQAIFNSSGDHVNKYGTWLVYKVWIE